MSTKASLGPAKSYTNLPRAPAVLLGIGWAVLDAASQAKLLGQAGISLRKDWTNFLAVKVFGISNPQGGFTKWLKSALVGPS